MVRISVLGGFLSVSSAFVYETRELNDTEIMDLINSETFGWAVPLGDGTDRDPEIPVWFSTEDGNFRIDIGEISTVYAESLVRFSLNSDHMMIMQLLNPDHGVEGSMLPGRAQHGHWFVDGDIKIGQMSTGYNGPIEIDFRTDDIWLPSSAIVWPAHQVKKHKRRIFLSCQDPQGDLMIGTGGISVAIHEARFPEVDPTSASLRAAGWCPVNVMVLRSEGKPRIGRSILETNDVVFDGINGRIVVSHQRGVEPATPLVRFRYHNWWSSDTETGIEWKRSSGELGETDFVFTRLAVDEQEIEMICFGAVCDGIVPEEVETGWAGTPKMEIRDDLVTIAGEFGWKKHEMEVMPMGAEFGIEFRAVGYRMMRDHANCIEGKKLEFIPVQGPQVESEFSVPVWPPFKGSGMMISNADPVEMNTVVGSGKRWYGKPVLEISEGGHIVISADASASADDRLVELVTSSDESHVLLDFSVIIRRYAPAAIADPGFVFRPLGRSERSEFEFEVLLNEAQVKQFVIAQDGTINLPVRPPAAGGFQAHRVTSPPGRWIGEPVISVDPESGVLTISHSREGEAWTYWCSWELVNTQFPRLVFRPIPTRLRIEAPASIDLSSSEWSLKSASDDWTGLTATVRKGKYFERFPDGSIDILLEYVDGPIFTSSAPLRYVGRPSIGVNQDGDLIVRSNGDSIYEYVVQVFEEYGRSIRINFKPTRFMAVGSRPVLASGPGDDCPICLDEYGVDEIIAETICKHRFHLECLTSAGRSSCPLCRGSLVLI